MLGAFLRLSIRLEAVSQVVQELANQPVTCLMVLHRQFPSQHPRALASPAQRRFRISTADRLDQRIQCLDQVRVARGRRLPSTTSPTKATGLRYALQPSPRRSSRSAPRPRLFHPTDDRAPRDPRRSSHQRRTAIPQGLSLGSRPQPSRALVQRTLEHPELLPDHLKLRHASSIARFSYFLADPDHRPLERTARARSG